MRLKPVTLLRTGWLGLDLGLKREADAIGRHIVVNGGTTVTISGVVQDFQS